MGICEREATKDIKSGWCSAQDIVNEHGITIYELFDYIKKGLPTYTKTHKEVFDGDFLSAIKKNLLIYFTAKVKDEHQDHLLDEDKIYSLAEYEYNIRFRDIFEHPQGKELISFNELLRNTLSDVWTFQFKTADVDQFFGSNRHAVRSYDEILVEKEQQAWHKASEIIGIGSEEIKRVAADYVREDLQNIMTKNRQVIRTKAEDGGSEADNSLLSIILDNRSTISELANSEGTEGERELKAFHLISALAESEEVQKAVHEYHQSHSTKASETSLPHAMQEQPEKPIGTTTIPTDKQPELETLEVSDYIKGRRKEGVDDDIIAYELHNPKGTYRLTYLEVTRALGKNENSNESQVLALKKRGERACKQGEKKLQELDRSQKKRKKK